MILSKSGIALKQLTLPSLSLCQTDSFSIVPHNENDEKKLLYLKMVCFFLFQKNSFISKCRLNRGHQMDTLFMCSHQICMALLGRYNLQRQQQIGVCLPFVKASEKFAVGILSLGLSSRMLFILLDFPGRRYTI